MRVDLFITAGNIPNKMADIPNADVCYLDKMPPEVRQKIFGFAIILEKDVAPFQVKKRSNKFFWDKAQKDPKKASDVPQLTAVHLSRCSKKIYDEVATTHLFYQVNQYVLNPSLFPESTEDNN